MDDSVVEIFLDNVSNSDIKSKIQSGEYSISARRGRSTVWKIFGRIETQSGQLIAEAVVCRVCNNIYKFSKSTSNLLRHKCYAMRPKENIVKRDVDIKVKKEAAQIFTEWCIENCRPLHILDDSGFRKLAEFIISVGGIYGHNVDVNRLLPRPVTISRNIDKLYIKCFEKLTSEIAQIKNIGFGLTYEHCTDNFLHKSFLAINIHYVKNGKLCVKLLGIKSMDDEKCTSK